MAETVKFVVSCIVYMYYTKLFKLHHFQDQVGDGPRRVYRAIFKFPLHIMYEI